MEEEAHVQRGEALVRALVHVGPVVKQEVDNVNVTVNLQGGASLARTAGTLSRGQDPCEAPCPSQLRGGPHSRLPQEEAPRPPPCPTLHAHPTVGHHGGRGRAGPAYEGPSPRALWVSGPVSDPAAHTSTLRGWGAHSSGGEHRVALGIGHVGAGKVVPQDPVNPVVIPFLGLQDHLLGEPLLGPMACKATPPPLQDGIHVPAAVSPLVPGGQGASVGEA